MIKWDLSLDGSIHANQKMCYITVEQDKNHMIISIYAKKASDKIHYLFIIKILNKLDVEEIYLNIIKPIYKEPTAIITLCSKS